MAMVRRGFGILCTWRMLEIGALTLIIYLPDALSLWLLVKAVGLALGFADTLVLVGLASLSTLVPSGPASFGTLQFAYALQSSSRAAHGLWALWRRRSSNSICCFRSTLVATGILLHGSGKLLSLLIKGRSSDEEMTGPRAGKAGGP
jgi:uncharacterized membrane protein YbhN (UPF0104 family)